MSDFMQQPIRKAPGLAPAWLHSLQQRGREAWQHTALPTRKTEAWKYTNLQALQQRFVVADPDSGSTNVSDIDFPQLEGPTLVFTDGHYNPSLSSRSLPSGVSLVRFAEADKQQADRLQSLLGSAVASGRHVFVPLNEATLADGVFLEIAPDTRVEQPLHVVWLTSGADTALGLSQRLLVSCGAHSDATLVETFASSDTGAPAFTNGVTELLLEDNAQLQHYRLHLEEDNAVHIGGVHAHLAQDSTLRGFHLALGSDLKRVDIVVDHQGSGAHCELDGIYLPRGSEIVDYHTCIEHSVPHCTSRERFRGIIGDEACAIFNGRIHIHPQAQKTRAELSNKNLLTSNKAEVNTKPELEIYADDVQCAHGATVAQLDPSTLHYLRTRGIPREEAEVMLSYGFINELVEDIRSEPLRNFIKPLLAKRFARNPRLLRHLL